MQKDAMMKQNSHMNNEKTPITVTTQDGKTKELKMSEVLELIQNMQESIKQKDQEIINLKKQIEILNEKN